MCPILNIKTQTHTHVHVYMYIYIYIYPYIYIYIYMDIYIIWIDRQIDRQIDNQSSVIYYLFSKEKTITNKYNEIKLNKTNKTLRNNLAYYVL